MTNYIHDYIQSRFLILKMAKTLDFSRVFVWCGKQDLNLQVRTYT